MMSKRKAKYLLAILRSFLLISLFCLSAIFTGVLLRYNSFTRHVSGFWNVQRYYRVNLIYSLLVFFSLASVFCLNNNKLRQAFEEREKTVSGIRFVFTSIYFRIEIAIMFACSLLFSFSSPFIDLTHGYLAGLECGFAVKKILSLAILFPILVLLDFLAHLSTIIWWSDQKKKTKSKTPHRSMRFFLLQLSCTVALSLFCSSAMTLVCPMLTTVFVVLNQIKIPLLIVILVTFLMFYWMRYMQIIHSRRKLIRQLKRLKKELGLKITVNAHPYFSAIRPDEGYHLMIRSDKKKIACRFIASPKSTTALYLHENGFATYVNDYVLFKHYASEKYFFDAESDTKKIILVCPCRGKIFKKNDEQEQLADVGDKMMEYRIYNSEGFINAIRRDCI